jgi:hypothetical protein
MIIRSDCRGSVASSTTLLVSSGQNESQAVTALT